jgi:hypothetical protein
LPGQPGHAPDALSCTLCTLHAIWVRHASLVPPAPFGGVKRPVSRLNQAASIAALGRSLRCHAKANRDDASFARRVWNPQIFHLLPDALGDYQRALLVGIPQNQPEFFATVSGHDVCRTLGRRGNGLRYRA